MGYSTVQPHAAVVLEHAQLVRALRAINAVFLNPCCPSDQVESIDRILSDLPPHILNTSKPVDAVRDLPTPTTERQP